MNHATVEDLHDHAYGFRLSDHVATCPDCDRACAQLLDEREVLRDSLKEEEAPEVPAGLLVPRRSAPRRISPPGMAAAALLLATLAAMLLHREVDRTPAAPPLQSQESEIYRLIGELKSPSPVRKKIARLALTKYGGAALDAIVTTQADQDLVDTIRGETPEDRAVTARMKKERVTILVKDTLYTEVFRTLEPRVGRLRVDVDGSEIETALITAELRDVTVQEAVERICAQMKVPFSVRFGTLLIGKRSDPMALAPVRIPARPADVDRLLGSLSSDDPDRRDKASAQLRRLGFAAEPALWRALDSDSAETRNRAAELLQEIYGGVPYSESVPAGGHRKPNVTIDCSNTPIQDVIAEILRQSGGTLPLIWDSRAPIFEENVSFRVQGLPADAALRLLLEPRGIQCLVGRDSALISTTGATTLATPSPCVLWLRPALARELETLIADLASTDPQRHEKVVRGLREVDAAGTPGLSTVLDALAAASWALDGDALRRCQRLRRGIAASHRMWIPELPSGADLQTLTVAQRDLLNARVALPVSDALTLEQLLQRDGVRCDVRTPAPIAYRGMGKEPARGDLLRITLRPEGLDFYLKGETVVIDTAERVQEAVEK